MCQNAFFPCLCLQGIRMRTDLQERKQNMDVWSAKKKIKQPENKFTALFKYFVKKNFFFSFTVPEF